MFFRELGLFVAFSWRDWSTTVVPSYLFAAGVIKDLSYGTVARNLLLLLVWITLYIYGFNLFTQVMSPEEDRVNKPDRPIPSGKISVEAAWKRCIIVWMLFFAIPFSQHQIIPETIAHALFTMFLGATKAGGHWIGKNIIAMSVGTAVLISASRKLMSPVIFQTWHQTVHISLWAGLIAHAQDFRDQDGDRKVGRWTLPLAFGDHTARLILAFFLIPLAFVVILLSDFGQIAPWLLGALHSLIACRMLMFRDKKSDHQTYMVSNGAQWRRILYGDYIDWIQLLTYTFGAIATISSYRTGSNFIPVRTTY